MSNINDLVYESLVQSLGITPERALSAARQAAVWGTGSYLGYKAGEDKKKKKEKSDVHLVKPISNKLSDEEKERIKKKRKKLVKVIGAGALAGGLGAIV